MASSEYMTDPAFAVAKFPNLATEKWEPTSDASFDYNCIAWAAGEQHRVWWPYPPPTKRFWPTATREETVACFRAAFGTRGYTRCDDGSLEPGWEKIALYVDGDDTPTHMARQCASGIWTSKCGDFEDIVHHTLRALEGELYGTAKYFMKRRRDGGHDQA